MSYTETVTAATDVFLSTNVSSILLFYACSFLTLSLPLAVGKNVDCQGEFEAYLLLDL